MIFGHDSKLLCEGRLSDFISALSMTNLKTDLEKITITEDFCLNTNLSEILNIYGMKAKTS